VLHLNDDLRVLTVKESAEWAGLSLSTFKRLQRDGEGPAIVQLSERRIGIRFIDLTRWLAERMRP
jgi:predicted DNA-binding transcriptional regulator AlpA